MAHHKLQLAKKTCPVCLRPFSWRKKWEKCWDQVKYCSKRCQNKRNASSNKE